jgi:hypothetical protein
MALAFLVGGYQAAPGSCTPSTKLHDNSAGDQTTYEESTGGGTANLCGIVDCGTFGPQSPVHQVKAQTYQGGGNLAWLLEYSNDGSSWNTVTPNSTGVDNTWGQRLWTLAADQMVRYYRISAHLAGIFRIGDLRIYDASGTEIIASATGGRRRGGAILTT